MIWKDPFPKSKMDELKYFTERRRINGKQCKDPLLGHKRRNHRQTQWNIIQPQGRKILPLAVTWMELEGIMLKEMSDREKFCMISMIKGI